MIIRIAVCSEDTLRGDLTEIIDAFPFGAEDASRLRSLKNDAALRLSVAARVALRSLCPEGGTIVRGEHGKPCFAEDGAPHFSLSHAGGLAVAAVADEAPIGVDLELFRDTIPAKALAKRFFSDEDLALLSRHGDFFALWTKKEAVSKLVGTPLTEALSKRIAYPTRTYRDGSFTLSVAAEQEFSIEFSSNDFQFREVLL